VFRASEIMMRLNTPITARLALAVLYLLPVNGLAKSTHHHLAKANVSVRAPKRHVRGELGAEPVAHTVSRHMSRHVARPIAHSGRNSHLSRYHSTAKLTGVRESRHAPRRFARATSRVTNRVRSRSEETAVQGPPQKATTADFLEAASAPLQVQPAMAIHGTSQPAELNEAPSPSISVTHKPASSPVPVVSVIRPTAERPQLNSVEDAASTPVILPTLYNKRGRLIVPAPLKGSHEILIHQNQVADRDGLSRVQNDEDLIQMRDQKLLVALPASSFLEVDERLPENRRYCRPWTAQFLATMARAHYAHFHTVLQVNSAVRTVEFQQHLLHINGNAAPAEGDTASPHLTGQAIDIAKHGLSLTEIAWMRGYLLPLVQEGKVDVEEEFQQSCFHISVYKRYLPPVGSPGRYLASSHRSETSALAAAAIR
jgi:Family of unknown function (DUF5715)